MRFTGVINLVVVFGIAVDVFGLAGIAINLVLHGFSSLAEMLLLLEINL